MVDINRPNPAAGNLPGAMVFAGDGAGRIGQKRFYPTDWSNLGPRIGFAYKLFPKTVLRGGWGIFYQTLGNGGCGCRIGFSNPITVVSDGVNPVLQWDNGIAPPPGFRPPPLLDPLSATSRVTSMYGLRTTEEHRAFTTGASTFSRRSADYCWMWPMSAIAGMA
jgi:hypothetical protein